MAVEARTSGSATTTGRPRERGFTLLEVVVAATIAALALIGLFRSGGIGLLAVDQAARVEEAIERAQSHLAAFGRAETLAPGDREGDDGGGYRWRLSATPVEAQRASPEPEALPALALFDVKVTISWRTRGSERSVVIETLRLGSAAISPEQ